MEKIKSKKETNLAKKKPKILMKNNFIVKARYDLSIIENRVFQLILFKFQKQNSNDMILEMQLKDFSDLIKKRNDKTIEAISNMLEKMRKGSLEIKTDKQWLRYGFINGATYDNEKQCFIIKADAYIYKLLFDYLKGYTPVNMATFFNFKSYYAQRFYELLRLWSNSKTIINYSIEELRDLLMLGEKHKAYCDFKKRVINPSIKELNEKSLMQIEIKENKTGRKVNSIDFIVTDNDKRKYFEESKNVLEHQQGKHKKQNEPKKLKCMNFDEREYDYNSLEKKLLGWEED